MPSLKLSTFRGAYGVTLVLGGTKYEIRTTKKIPRNELINPSTLAPTTFNIDCSLSNNVYFVVGGGSTNVTQTFSGVPRSYVLYKLIVILEQGVGGDKSTCR